jgi:hypothetical protein
MDLNSSWLFVSISILILLHNMDMKHVPFCVNFYKKDIELIIIFELHAYICHFLVLWEALIFPLYNYIIHHSL